MKKDTSASSAPRETEFSYTLQKFLAKCNNERNKIPHVVLFTLLLRNIPSTGIMYLGKEQTRIRFLCM